ncbi:unnamed protein product [Gadus morhua 'NCC']
MAVSARVQTYCLYLAGHHRAPAKSSYCGLGPLPPSLQHISSGAINRLFVIATQIEEEGGLERGSLRPGGSEELAPTAPLQTKAACITVTPPAQAAHSSTLTNTSTHATPPMSN